MKKKVKLQIYTATNDYFIPTITIGKDSYYLFCDRSEIMSGRVRKLIKYGTSSRPLHEAILRSTERGEHYTKIVSGYIAIDNYDITRGELSEKSSEVVINKTIEYLSTTLGWKFPDPTTLSL